MYIGTAVYIFAIQSHSSDPNAEAAQSFFIDGHHVGNYSFIPSGQPTFDYNVLLYHNTSIPPGRHEIILQNSWSGGPHSLILLDYIIYTAE